MDTAKAVKATAHQLARLIYAMLTKGQPYAERGIDVFEAQSNQHRQHHNTWSVTRDRLYRCALQEAATYCCRVHVLFAVTTHF